MTHASLSEPQRFLPDANQTLLLKACLLSGDAARSAWLNWKQRSCSPQEALQGKDRLWVKRLLPLLFHSARRNNLDTDSKTSTFLKMAYTAEVERDSYCRRVGHQVLRELADSRVFPVVLGGFAYAETVYQESSLRHCDELELHLGKSDAGRAGEVFSRLNFSASRDSTDEDLRFIHASGFPVAIRQRLLSVDFSGPLCREMIARCRRQSIAGVDAQVLCGADAFLEACVTGWTIRSNVCPLWLCDIWLHRQHVKESASVIAGDSDLLARLGRPLEATLDYLSTTLETDLRVNTVVEPGAPILPASPGTSTSN